jgi:hypothetical protein
MLDVYELTGLVQAVNATHVGVFPANSNMKTLVAELNLLHTGMFTSYIANWSR